LLPSCYFKTFTFGRCGVVVLDQLHVLTAAHCFFKRHPDYEEGEGASIFNGEIQSHLVSDLDKVAKYSVVVGREYFGVQTFNQLQVSEKYQFSSVDIHPQYDPRCSVSDYDLAVVTLKGTPALPRTRA